MPVILEWVLFACITVQSSISALIMEKWATIVQGGFMDRFERRKYKRWPIRLTLSCCKMGTAGEKSYRGCTINVSPGGLYFETLAGIFKPGKLIKIELSIPPTAGVLEFGGMISGFANVLRTINIRDSHTKTKLSPGRYGVAVEFCQRPKLCM